MQKVNNNDPCVEQPPPLPSFPGEIQGLSRGSHFCGVMLPPPGRSSRPLWLWELLGQNLWAEARVGWGWGWEWGELQGKTLLGV